MGRLDNPTEDDIKSKEAENKARMEKQREEREKKEKAEEGQKLVIDMAKISCSLCTNPQGILKVNFDTPTIQNKKTATVKEKSAMSLIFMGNCIKSPNAAIPCAAVMQLGEWKDTGIMKVQNQSPLLLKSTIPCLYGSVDIKITDCGQANIPGEVVTDGPPVPAEKKEIEIKVVQNTFVPFGIENFRGEKENDKIKFKIKAKKGTVENLTFYIKHDGTTLYTEKLSVTTLEKGEETEVQWDGFSDEKVYENVKFLTGELTAEVSNGSDEAKVKIKVKREEGKWVDIRINKSTHEIEALLRINLTDASPEGLSRGNKVSAEALASYGVPVITTQTKSQEQLTQMALEGVNKYWSRNDSNGKDVTINGEKYKISITSKKTNENSLKAPEITFVTNDESKRSRNFFLSRILYYNAGYLYYSDWKDYPSFSIFTTKGWAYETEADSDKNYIETAAHEIGHEILKDYGGMDYSFSHKETSTVISQSPLGGTTYPGVGEIDLMKYAKTSRPPDFHARVIASERDVLSIIWSSMLKIS